MLGQGMSLEAIARELRPTRRLSRTGYVATASRPSIRSDLPARRSLPGWSARVARSLRRDAARDGRGHRPEHLATIRHWLARWRSSASPFAVHERPPIHGPPREMS